MARGCRRQRGSQREEDGGSRHGPRRHEDRPLRGRGARCRSGGRRVVTAGRRRLEERILAQDCLLELLERWARVDPELLDEYAPGLLVRLQRLGLTPGPVERQHQLAPQPLPQRVLGHKRLHLADEIRVTAEREIGLDALLERHEPQLLEARDRRLGERLVREVGKRLPTPQRERRAQEPCRLLRVAGRACSARAIELALEARDVELVRLDSGDVPGWTGRDHGLAAGLSQSFTQLGDVDLDDLRGRRRRLVAPELVDQAVNRNDLVRPQQEDGEQRTLLRSSERQDTSTVSDLERAEKPEVQSRLLQTNRG